MTDLNDSQEHIKLDRETIFHHHLAQDKEKLALYDEAVQKGLISNFDQVIITRLRKLYYGLYSGLIYMYYAPTDFDNIGDKAELLTHAIEDKDYTLVHGLTDSTKDIPFYLYDANHLDCNVWFEIREGQKVWVYDLFSMLKIEKSVYYALEHPQITKSIPKDILMDNQGRFREDYSIYNDGFNFMLLKLLPEMEKNLEKHPFKELLESEITRFKKDVDYENIRDETEEFLENHQRR